MYVDGFTGYRTNYISDLDYYEILFFFLELSFNHIKNDEAISRQPRIHR